MLYQAPTSIAEAINCLSAAPAPTRILAGGTDLLVQLRAGLIKPALVIDIKGIPETRNISQRDKAWIVGAAVSGAEFNEHPELPKVWPGLAEAFDLIGSTQIQGRATLGGNLCNASPAADTVPAMIAAGAVARVVGAQGERDIPLEAVCSGPGKTQLAPDEFIVSFRLPARSAGDGDAYLRFTPRTEMDIAVVGAAVNIRVHDDGKISSARVALGAVAPTALLVNDAAQALIGGKLEAEALNKLQIAARAACKPIDDKRGTIAFRTQVAGVLAERAALVAYERALATLNAAGTPTTQQR